ncbi:MAG: hypothetical protein E6Q96_04375 [Cyclobacteriaceae bacterium]|nr:MAG: hypothetical protein E6Q96_04375 [Cyclobacteriaceae bacterium]
MKTKENKGYNPQVIADYKKQMQANGQPYIVEEGDDDNNDEYLHFYFIGKDDDGAELVYDAVMYTLRMQHESELFEIAEHKAAQHFPDYKKIAYEEDENGDLSTLDSRQEEIGLYMAEVILDLEEEEAVKVQEHVDMDKHVDFGIALDIGLHVEAITPEVVEKFIDDFNSDNLQLDDTLYSFQTTEEEADH